MIFLCFIPSIARLEPELEQFELRSIFVGISAIHCWLVWGSRQQANGDGDSDCDGDGDQLLSTAGHPLHHLLVGHQRQFSPSKVHIPPNNNDNDGALDSVQKGYDLAQIQQSAAEKLNTSVQIHFAMRMSTLEATFDKV